MTVAEALHVPQAAIDLVDEVLKAVGSSGLMELRPAVLAAVLKAYTQEREGCAALADGCVRERKNLAAGIVAAGAETNDQRLVWLACKEGEAARIAEAIRKRGA